MKTILSALGLSLLIFTSCGGQKKVEVDFIQDNIDNAVAQNTIQTDSPNALRIVFIIHGLFCK